MKAHAHLPALCVHLNDGWRVELYWTMVSPSAFTWQLGAWPGAKMTAGAAAMVPTRAAMAKERMFEEELATK